MKIYIFASREINKESSEKIRNLRITTNDFVVLCNEPSDNSVKYLFQQKYKNRLIDFRFLRGHPHQLNDDYSIRLKNDFNHRHTEYYISEADHLDKILKINKIRGKIIHDLKNIEQHNNEYLNEPDRYRKLGVKYDGNLRPSIGFIAAKLMRLRFPNSKIYLCGFTFEMNGLFHDSEFEKNHLLNDNENYFII